MKRYETYKETNHKWYPVIPKEWKVCKVKHIAKTYAGGTPSTVKTEYWNKGNIPWLPSGKLQNGDIAKAEKFITEEGLNGSSTKWIKSNTVLVALTGATCANIGYLKFKACANQSVVAIDEFKDKANSRFLYFMFLMMRKQILTHQTGGAQAGINDGNVKNLYLTLPSLQEQTQIANYLDYKTGLIDAIIAQKETLIKKLKEQRQAIINEAVTKGLNPDVKLKDSGIEWLGEIPEHWKVCKFRYKFDTTKGLTITKANLQEQGIPCVNYGEIHSRYGFELNPEVHNLKYVSEEYLETNKVSLLSKGDFVFADTSEDIEGAGNFTHLNSGIPTFAGYHTIIARLNDNSHFRFIAYFMDSSSYRSQIQNLVKGVKVYSITNKILKDTILFFPPKEEQKMIAEYIDIKVKKIFMSTEKLEKSIQKLKEYRQSLISEAVTGKVDVRDWEAPKS